jgi:hypothetical protein
MHLPDMAWPPGMPRCSCRSWHHDGGTCSGSIAEPACVLAEQVDGVVKRLRAQQEMSHAARPAGRICVGRDQFHELLVELAANKTLTMFSELSRIVDRHHHDTFARASA